MDNDLTQAYIKIFGENPTVNSDWQLAEKIVENWNVPKLGEDLAKLAVLKAINGVNYPDDETAKQIMAKFLSLATELWPELPEEPHVAQIEYLEYCSAIHCGIRS